MEIPTDVFDCGTPCLSDGPAGWGEVVLVFILLGFFVYTGIRNLSPIAQLEKRLVDSLWPCITRLGWFDSRSLQTLQDLDEEEKLH